MNELVNEINLKLVLLGNGGVGKSSLIQSIIDSEVDERYIPTIGSNIIKKDYFIKKSNSLISVNLWELGGQRAFNPLNPVFFTNVDIAFIVFDLSKPKDTISDIKKIYLDNLLKKSTDCIVFLIGNKLDLNIDENKLDKIIKEINITEYPLVCISALKKINIEDLMNIAVYNFLKTKKEEFENNGIENLSNLFLEINNRTETDLKSIIVNSAKINIGEIQKKKSLVVSQKKIEKEQFIVDEKIPSKDKFKDLDLVKPLIKTNFNQNILSIEYMISSLKRTPIQSLNDSIDKILNELKTLKKDFELKLNTIMDINNLRSNEKTINNKNILKEGD
ncbi:MAG: GTP-binding protein [Candidatus Lokiarchaeota archaeon]|nr:GTP-binding protein [Candidatus Lokiarchaeota archaeon]